MSAGTDLKTAQAAKPECYKVFRDLAGEVAVGITPLDGGKFGLKVNLKSPPEKGIKLPTQVQGVPVRVDVVGKIRKR